MSNYDDENLYPEGYWQLLIELNDKMSNKFFELKKKYGDFPTANELVKKKLKSLNKNFPTDNLFELNYYEYESQDEEIQPLLFDLSQTMYVGDMTYNALQEAVLNFINKASKLSHKEKLIPLLTSLNRIVLFWGNSLDLIDIKKAYKVLCKMAHKQINASIQLLEDYQLISNKHEEIADCLRSTLLEIDCVFRHAFYNVDYR